MHLLKSNDILSIKSVAEIYDRVIGFKMGQFIYI
jgi:hypothetical protein